MLTVCARYVKILYQSVRDKSIENQEMIRRFFLLCSIFSSLMEVFSLEGVWAHRFKIHYVQGKLVIGSWYLLCRMNVYDASVWS